jgi:hypothetical protein
MIIEPLKGVGPVGFGMSGEQIETLVGRPISIQQGNETGWVIWDYGRVEVAGAYFRDNKLTSLFIVPTPETILWRKVLHRMRAEAIKELIAANGHGCDFIPSCHPAVRPQIISQTAGLHFALKDDYCDDIEVLSLQSLASMTT